MDLQAFEWVFFDTRRWTANITINIIYVAGRVAKDDARSNVNELCLTCISNSSVGHFLSKL